MIANGILCRGDAGEDSWGLLYGNTRSQRVGW